MMAKRHFLRPSDHQLRTSETGIGSTQPLFYVFVDLLLHLNTQSTTFAHEGAKAKFPQRVSA